VIQSNKPLVKGLYFNASVNVPGLWLTSQHIKEQLNAKKTLSILTKESVSRIILVINFIPKQL
jgi:hypothetical protein